MSSADSNSMLIDLFRQEVQGQVQVLNDGLVALEQNANPRQIEPLMRAAHSVKGAARLLGIDPAVKLAHVMEDCLVAVQQGSLSMTASGIDLLLAGTDWLGQFGESAGQDFATWYAPHDAAVTQLISQLEAFLRGEVTAPASIQPLSSSSETHNVELQAESSGSAESIAAGSALSGSALTESASLQPADSEPVVEWSVSQAEAIDPGALMLFHDEMRSGQAVLASALEAWQAPLTSSGNAQVMEAFANMRGVSLLLRIQPLAQLIKLCESAWLAARPTERAINTDEVRCFSQAIELFQHLSSAVGGGYAEQVANHQEKLVASLNELNQRAQSSASGSSASSSARPTVQLDRVGGAATGSSASIAPKSSGSESAPGNSAAFNATKATSTAAATATPSTPATSTTSSSITPSTTAAEPEDAQERVVRVTAKNLTRLMGLAGESLVEARWLQPFAQSLTNLKREQDRLTDVIDELAESIPPEIANSHSIIKEMRSKLQQSRNVLGGRIEEFESHARRSDDLNSRLYNEVIACRMRPMSDGVQGYPRMVRDISRQLGKNVRYEIVGETTPVDRDVLEKLDAPLNHILRNALDHGIETPEERLAAGKPEVATLKLEARHSAGMFAITISDDGRGIDLERLKAKIVERKLTTAEMVSRMTEAELYEFLFLPGFSTRGSVTEISGRGVGLDVVHTMATSVGGTVRIQSQLGKGTSFHLNLPITLSVIRAVLVEIAGEPYAFPLNRIDRLLRVAPDSIGSLEHRQFLRVDGQNVGVVLGTQILRIAKRPQASSGNGTSNSGSEAEDLFIVLFSNHNDQYGMLVDGFLGEQDLVVRPLDHRLGKVPNVSAAAVLDDGSPALIVDVDDVRRAIERLLEAGKLERTDESGRKTVAGRKKRVLVVDDSITVREVERQLLTSRGYDVTVAVDGADGWNTIREGEFDLVISDIDMPHMNGLEFTKKIKNDNQLQRIPVVIVSYKDREEDRLAGLEAGANYYLTKSSFHDESLLEAVHDLIGEAQ